MRGGVTENSRNNLRPRRFLAVAFTRTSRHIQKEIILKLWLTTLHFLIHFLRPLFLKQLELTPLGMRFTTELKIQLSVNLIIVRDAECTTFLPK